MCSIFWNLCDFWNTGFTR